MNYRLYLILLIFMLSGMSCSFSGEETPVDKYGWLSVDGRYLVDQSGTPVYLTGMSLYWSEQSGSFYKDDVVDYLVNQWDISIIRAAMGVVNRGYMVNPEIETEKITTITDQAIKKGIYVIIDWHDHFAPDHIDQAKSFFIEMAEKYKDDPNVMFEIFNEPVEKYSWKEIKAYSVEIIDAIRSTGSNNIIIVSTPEWCQEVQIAAADPIKGFENIIYALHYYAASHKEELRNNAQKAIDLGLPLIVSEWGTCEYTGDGFVDIDSSLEWIKFMKENYLSWCNWSFFMRDEAASALRPEASFIAPWSDDDLSTSGRFIKEQIQLANN